MGNVNKEMGEAKGGEEMSNTNQEMEKDIEKLIKRYGYKRVKDEAIAIGWKNYCDSGKKLSQKDVDFLECLWRLDFLTIEQVGQLFFPHLSRSGWLYNLNKFSSQSLVHYRSFSSRNHRIVVWRLTWLGLKAMCVNKGYGEPDYEIIRTMFDCYLRDKLSVRQIFIDLAEEHGGYKGLLEKIDWFPFCMRQLKYIRDEKAVSQRKRRKPSHGIIYPDAVIKTHTSNAKVYLEYDGRGNSMSFTRESLHAYAQYFKEDEEQHRRCVVLLYVVDDELRKDYIQRIADEIQKTEKLPNFRVRLYGRETLDLMNTIIRGPQK